ncbi:protein KTI12 homolog [Fopius arisanus]|uniref:Protein KTI12 homolog n=1 Tax=Fopius arisanus TaxID=64838 RepID=A0A9R1T300_9HYME|nr:PREDICTED: protein KTI12 homolog [Fopius arisanus]
MSSILLQDPEKMPLIIITGIPSSGKTRRALEIKSFLEDKNKKVEVLSESELVIKSGFDKNDFYMDSKKEKAIRSEIRSSVQRTLNSKDVLIVDGSNYIKGSRYELFCLSKLYKTPQCTIHCDLPGEHAWLLNCDREEDRYSRDTFDALLLRYETPNNKNRWDSPLFSVTPEDKLPLDDIYHSLYSVDAPKPNMSTQSPTVSATNYLYELDKITQEIVNVVTAADQMGITSDIKLPSYNLIVDRSTSAAQLTRLRRQFLTYSKMHQVDLNQIAQLFVQYLNKSI